MLRKTHFCLPVLFSRSRAASVVVQRATGCNPSRRSRHQLRRWPGVSFSGLEFNRKRIERHKAHGRYRQLSIEIQRSWVGIQCRPLDNISMMPEPYLSSRGEGKQRYLEDIPSIRSRQLEIMQSQLCRVGTFKTIHKTLWELGTVRSHEVAQTLLELKRRDTVCDNPGTYRSFENTGSKQTAKSVMQPHGTTKTLIE